jgi:hypothetical protein
MTDKYLLERQNKKLGLAVKEEKRIYQIPRRSKSLASEMRKYVPEMKAFLAKPENEFCKIRMKGCTNKAACVHHPEGRIGKKLRDQSKWIPSCGSCNLQVEIKDLEAREKGFKNSRLKKEI